MLLAMYGCAGSGNAPRSDAGQEIRSGSAPGISGNPGLDGGMLGGGGGIDAGLETHFWEVKDRIVATRNQDIEYQMLHYYGIPLAGLVDFSAALDGWAY